MPTSFPSRTVPHHPGCFDDPKRDSLSHTVDKINKKYSKQRLVYFGGLHGLGDAAPTRIPFFRVPDLSDSFDSAQLRPNSILWQTRLFQVLRKECNPRIVPTSARDVIVGAGSNKIAAGVQSLSKDQDGQLGQSRLPKCASDDRDQ
jgi:hypothetical protein